MNEALERVTDWDKRAARAKWCVHGLAERCSVSPRTLERYFKQKYGVTPKDWLVRLRMQRAVDALEKDAHIKTASVIAGYKNQYHFSREFKKMHGYPPSKHADY